MGQAHALMGGIEYGFAGGDCDVSGQTLILEPGPERFRFRLISFICHCQASGMQGTISHNSVVKASSQEHDFGALTH